MDKDKDYEIFHLLTPKTANASEKVLPADDNYIFKVYTGEEPLKVKKKKKLLDKKIVEEDE
jgi:hypothetical protein